MGDEMRAGEELRAEAILEAAPDGMVVVDDQGIIRMANAAAGALFGYGSGELIGQPVEVLVPDDVREEHVEQRRRYREHPVARPMGAGRQLYGRRRDDTVFPVLISLSPLHTSTGVMTIAAVRDVSDWMEAEHRLAEADRRRAVAEDHERIARDLHDTVIQELFAVGMSLQSVHADARELPRVASRIASAVEALDETIRQVRATIFDLNHGARDIGLRSDLDQVVRALVPSLGFEPDLDLRGPLETAVTPEAAPQVVATVREALTNVARHARASRAEVIVEVTAATIRVRVADDGVGVDADAVHRSGLANLARRAADLGGSMQMGAREPRGTVLEWQVPRGPAHS